MRTRLIPTVLVIACAACHTSGSSTAPAAHSSTMALTPDGRTLYVANADADSVSEIDLATRTLAREILLAGAHPAVDTSSGAFAPAVMPRALALSPDGRTLYVTGERSGMLYEIATAAGSVTRSVAIGSEPVGVLVSHDGASVFAAASQDAQVVRVDARTLQVAATAEVAAKPWALALDESGTHLYATHLLGAAVSSIDPRKMTVAAHWTVPAVGGRGDRRLAHGEVRGLYDLAPRPGTAELWIAHLLLATDTAQPDLDFESTAFPALSLLGLDGRYQRTLSTDAQDVAGIDGAFSDVVSGPHALAFTRDGRYALVADANSEDVLVVDAASGAESSLLRPLPGHLPEGIVISPDETRAFVDERATGDVAVLAVQRDSAGLRLQVDGAPIARLTSDPMPAQMRLGQRLFHSANSDEFPITRNHWVACATCHIEGRSDAVTWRFHEGPRDTPSNAGGTIGTGFLLRTAARTRVQDYWETINVEQGGQFDPTVASTAALLDALAEYVNHGIPLPVPPRTDPQKVARGEQLFHDPQVGCSGCHSGPRFTDSGTGNPSLDLAGPVLLHNVGTCVTDGPFDDEPHEDIDGDPRDACMFDTPSLNGIADSAPYLHDGRAPTLFDVLEMTSGKMGDVTSLSLDDELALVEYLRSL